MSKTAFMLGFLALSWQCLVAQDSTKEVEKTKPSVEDSKPAEKRSSRAVWDQKKAEAIVQSIIDLENSGDFKWDNIPWSTDPKKVIEEARKSRKPIFLYFSF